MKHQKMKTYSFGILAMALSVFPNAHAEPKALLGSDTLGEVIREVIVADHLEATLSYIGGGSGKGLDAVIAKQQGIAPVSFAASAEKITQAKNLGIDLVPHVIGLDAVAILSQNDQASLAVDFEVLRGIFGCTLRKWENVPGSTLSGEISVYRLPDSSGTSGALLALTGLSKFGECAQTKQSPSDLVGAVASNALSIGYASVSTISAGVASIAVKKLSTDKSVLPALEQLRSRNYPLTRELLIYEAKGTVQLTGDEQNLLMALENPSIVGPILVKNGFIAL